MVRPSWGCGSAKSGRVHYHGLSIMDGARKAPMPEDYGADNNAVRELRPLLADHESVRRCIGCGRAYVGLVGDALPYCALAACQLKSRRAAPSHPPHRKPEN